MERIITVLYQLEDGQKAALAAAAAGRCALRYLEPFGEPSEIPDGTEVLIGHVEPEHIARAPALKWVQTAYAGVERVLGCVRAREGLLLTNGSGSFGEGIAEYLLMFTLMLQKNARRYTDSARRHEWDRRFEGAPMIAGSRVAVIGLGDLGGAFARKMHALGASVAGVKRTKAEKPDYLESLYAADGLDDALRDADVVALCLPSTDETAKIMSRERIFALKPGAILLNAGRGTAIDQDALIDALREKRVFAGLDVAAPEPLPPDSPLWDMENAVITPHISGFAALARGQRFMAGLIARNLAAYLDGRPLENVVDPRLGY
jgi:phosphoglycerate dehydrogenase-like enzyme